MYAVKAPKHNRSAKKNSKKLQRVQNEANEWKRRCIILKDQCFDEIQKVRLNVEMFKNEVLGVHKEMQMKCIDEILLAQK